MKVRWFFVLSTILIVLGIGPERVEKAREFFTAVSQSSG